MSTHVYASAVIAAPIDTVWNELRDFTSPSRLFSSTIDQVKMDDGASLTQVGGNRTVVWKNGVQRKHKLLELSDARRTISWELLPGSDDEVVSAVTAQQVTVSLKRVTQDNTTFISWETDFSADVASNIIKDEQQDLAQNLKDIQAFFSH
eukprot:TRINITY_DN119_c0_g1_i6.p1 TRINITY_DN119_c0_g1~~TRINITY_DN119_c0_g1_i6.p1  ORF type:complete len:168 (-),score=44.42 TRINITY_DN119_c0_g1_i6:152-601(-)